MIPAECPPIPWELGRNRYSYFKRKGTWAQDSSGAQVHTPRGQDSPVILCTETRLKTKESLRLDGRSPIKLCPLLLQLRVILYLLNDWVLELLGTPPLSDAGQAVCMIAIGENSKSPLRSRCLLKDHFHADTAHFVLTCLEGKGLLHLVLECRHADLKYSGGIRKLFRFGAASHTAKTKIRKEHGCGCFKSGPSNPWIQDTKLTWITKMTSNHHWPSPLLP